MENEVYGSSMAAAEQYCEFNNNNLLRVNENNNDCLNRGLCLPGVCTPEEKNFSTLMDVESVKVDKLASMVTGSNEGGVSSSKKKSNTKNSATKLSVDPQSVAARHRRHRISKRFRILQTLVPGGTKMDTASMLDEAIQYVKFLKYQIWFHEMMGQLVNPCYNNNNCYNSFLPSGQGFAPVVDGDGGYDNTVMFTECNSRSYTCNYAYNYNGVTDVNADRII